MLILDSSGRRFPKKGLFKLIKGNISAKYLIILCNFLFKTCGYRGPTLVLAADEGHFYFGADDGDLGSGFGVAVAPD